MENKNHTVTIDNCTKCVMSGIEKVVNATANQLDLISVKGKICVMGSDFSITRFDEQTNSLAFCGNVTTIKYNEVKVPFLKRIFK